MLPFLQERPVLRFLAEIITLVLLAVIIVGIAGWIWKWSGPIDYSNGFFFACVALAAIGSGRAVMVSRFTSRETPALTPPVNEKSQEWNALERFFARRSFNFKLLIAALACLFLSIWIGQG